MPSPDMDEHYAYNLWKYPRSGMQRGPWEAYGLMYGVAAAEADPRTFQEWKEQGYPHPDWFCTNLDPWYNNSGICCTLEAGHEAL